MEGYIMSMNWKIQYHQSPQISVEINSNLKQNTLMTFFSFLVKNDKLRDVSPGPGIENQPCTAEDSGSILGVRTKIPHATEDLSKSFTIRQSMCHNRFHKK